MDFEELLEILQTCVPEGCVTTYGNLATVAFGHPGAGKRITQLLNAAVDADYGNRTWTNRVVTREGIITGLNEARDQLISEGVPLLPNGNVNLRQCPPVNIIDCMDDNGSSGDDGTPSSLPPPDGDFEVSNAIISKWQDLHPPRLASDESFTWTGFDSAWSGNNSGAIAWMEANQFGLSFKGVKAASFNDCISHIDRTISSMHLLMIDQPTIVRNEDGRRPVECVIAHEIGRCRGGVQPANTGRPFFNSDASIWQFIKKLKSRNFSESTRLSKKANTGLYYLETFPALGNLGIFGWKECPKYKPSRHTFRLEHWQSICSAIGKIGEILDIDALPGWIIGMQEKDNPTDADQDQIDAVLCMLFGYIWWCAGLKYSVVIGDNNSGYMVVPCFREGLRTTLKTDRDKYDIPIDELFPRKKEPTGENRKIVKSKKNIFIEWLCQKLTAFKD